MTADLSSVAREAAEAESEARFGKVGRVHAYNAGPFVAGFTECASRLPSEGEIARVIAVVDEYDGCFDRIDAWEAATVQQRECGEVEEPLSYDQEQCDFWLRRARAVLALIGERISG